MWNHFVSSWLLGSHCRPSVGFAWPCLVWVCLLCGLPSHESCILFGTIPHLLVTRLPAVCLPNFWARGTVPFHLICWSHITEGQKIRFDLVFHTWFQRSKWYSRLSVARGVWNLNFLHDGVGDGTVFGPWDPRSVAIDDFCIDFYILPNVTWSSLLAKRVSSHSWKGTGGDVIHRWGLSVS